MSLPVNGFLQPVEIVVASTLPRNGYIQPVEVVAGVGVVTGSGVAGQVAYWDGATSITGNAGLTYVAASSALTVVGFVNVGTTTDAVAAGDFAAGLTGASRIFWDQNVGTLTAYDSASNAAFSYGVTSGRLNLGVATAIQGFLALYSTGAGAREANLFSPAGGGLQINTNSNTYPIEFNGSEIRLWPGATSGWTVNSFRHLVASVDNAYDIGASGATRPRMIYVGTSFLAPDGTAAAPSISFSGATNAGYYRAANTAMAAAFAGASVWAWSTDLILLRSSAALAWATGDPTSTGVGAQIVYGGANILEVKNGTAAQELRVYGTTTGPKYLSLAHNGSDAVINSSGAASRLVLQANAGNAVIIDTSGFLVFAADNTQDVGGSASTLRPRSGYFGTSISIGTNPAATGLVRLGNAGYVYGRNAANSADVHCIGITSGDRVLIGSGADVQWGPPLVALGGGAAPTFGTIGGSGPAAAAQNAWMRIVDSTGAAFWVPAWK